MQRIQNSWELVKASAAVLQADKELIIFPILSSIGVLLVSLTFALPMLFAGFFDSIVSGRAGDIRLLSLGIAFLFYFSQYVVIVFSNTALVGAAMIRLEGGDPTLGDGFRIAATRLHVIFGYALVASTVGMLLRALSSRSGSLGRLAISIIGLAWNLATFLVVPVLVVEDLGPFAAIKRSVSLLKRTWGEQIVGNLSIGLIFGLAGLLAAAVILGPGIYLAITFNAPALMIPVVGLAVLIFVGLSLVSSTMNGIYAAAVYRYATTGDAGHFFHPDLVQGAFKMRS